MTQTSEDNNNIARVGVSAPDFTATAVIGDDFKEISLTDYRGKYVVLFFYPLDFTFVCPTEIIEFDKRLEKFRKRNGEVIGVSVDSKFTHIAWKKTPLKEGGIGDIKYPLVADLNKSVSRSYGVLHEEELALRGTFIIDKEGIIQHITINNTGLGRSIEETLRILDALIFHEENGEVCPAEWHPGDSSIVPDPERKLEYFQ